MTNEKKTPPPMITIKDCGDVRLNTNTMIGDGPMIDVQNAETVSTSGNTVISEAAYNASQSNQEPKTKSGAKKHVIAGVAAVITGLIVAAASHYLGWT